MALKDHEFTTAGSYDDSTCDRCGKHISKQDESCIAPIEDNELREQIQSALHRIRTRSLRGAPVYLSHVNLAEHELMQLITAHTTRKETEARLDELKPVAFRVKDALSVKAAPRSFVRFHLTDEFIDKRTAELEQKLKNTALTP